MKPQMGLLGIKLLLWALFVLLSSIVIFHLLSTGYPHVCHSIYLSFRELLTSINLFLLLNDKHKAG